MKAKKNTSHNAKKHYSGDIPGYSSAKGEKNSKGCGKYNR